MSYENLPSYESIIQQLETKKRRKHLLFGNGFSIAYDHSIFTYNALSKFIEENGDESVRDLFKALNTTNFELIMKQLESFSKVVHLFTTDPDAQNKINKIIDTLKKSLIDAVGEVALEVDGSQIVEDTIAKLAVEIQQKYID